MSVISTDCGSSYLKIAVQGNDDVYCQPTLLTEVKPNGTSKKKIAVGGAWFVGGVEAMHSQGQIVKDPEIEADFYGSEKQKRQYTYAFSQMGLEGKQDKLIFSLPWKEYFSDNQLITKVKEDFKHFEWTTAQGEKKEVIFNDVLVCAQGMGALATIADNQDDIIIVEIGSCTVEILACSYDSDSKEYIYRDDLCSNVRDISVSTLYQQIMKNVNQNRNTSLKISRSYHDIKKRIHTENSSNQYKFMYKSQEVNFEEEFLLAKKQFTKELMDKLSFLLGDFFTNCDVVYISGGGQCYIDKDIWECNKKTSYGSIFDNVVGQLKMVS